MAEWIGRGAIGGLAFALLSGCSAPASSGTGRLTLLCDVEVSATTLGETEVLGSLRRLIWIDRDKQSYAVGELDEPAVDQDWLSKVSAQPGFKDGMAPILGVTGAFACFARGEDGGCVQGVDLERNAYAFASPFSANSPEGVLTGMLRGEGACEPDTQSPWLPGQPAALSPSPILGAPAETTP
jgi:hypothetical protein